MRRVSSVDLIRNFSSYSDVALREPIIENWPRSAGSRRHLFLMRPGPN